MDLGSKYLHPPAWWWECPNEVSRFSRPMVLLHGKLDTNPIDGLMGSCLLLHTESDARYGGFDFRAAHEEAPHDLQQLLDNNESLPFRRRGSGELVPSRHICPDRRFTLCAWINHHQSATACCGP